MKLTKKMLALTSNQGTAAIETALCEAHFAHPHAQKMARAQANHDVSLDAGFVDCTGNEVLACIICGAITGAECSVGCGRVATVDGLCAHCNEDWRQSEDRATVEHVADAMREAFIAKLRTRKDWARRATDKGTCKACGSFDYDEALNCRRCAQAPLSLVRECPDTVTP